MDLSRAKTDMSKRLSGTVRKGIALQCFSIDKGHRHWWEMQDHFFLPLVSVTGKILTLTLLLLNGGCYFHLTRLFPKLSSFHLSAFQNGELQRAAGG